MRQALAPPPLLSSTRVWPPTQSGYRVRRGDQGTGGKGARARAIKPGSRDVGETWGTGTHTHAQDARRGHDQVLSAGKTVAISGPDRGGDPSPVPCRSAEHHEQPIRWLVLCPSSLPGPAKPAAGGARLSHTRSSEGLGEEAKGDQIATREKRKSAHTTARSARTHTVGADLLAQRHGRAQPATSRSKERLARPGWQRMIKPDTNVPASPPASPDQGQHRMGCRGGEARKKKHSDRAGGGLIELHRLPWDSNPLHPAGHQNGRAGRRTREGRTRVNDRFTLTRKRKRGGAAIGQYPPLQ